MVRSGVIVVVCLALPWALAYPAPLHLHVARAAHSHVDHVDNDTPDVTHEHHAVVHAHGPTGHHNGQQPLRQPLSDASSRVQPHAPGQVVSLDTMLTELPSQTTEFAVTAAASSESPPDRVVSRLSLNEPRAHAPPGLGSSPSRAPPA